MKARPWPVREGGRLAPQPAVAPQKGQKAAALEAKSTIRWVQASAATRCHLVYALAPDGLPAGEANRLFNEYIGDDRRGLVVYHDHFIGRHGGVAVFEIRTDEERDLLSDPGPLAGWTIDSHPLVFSLTGVGFGAQARFTLERYRGTTLEELEAAEEASKRYWWQNP
jgi:hypothetical protein